MRRTAVFSLAAAATALLVLGGCSQSSSKDEDAAAAEQAAIAALYAPVESVRNIEVGRTRNGYVITAHGFAPGLGYSAPELRARRDGDPGNDGFIDFDFVVRAPDLSLKLGKGTLAARTVRADLLVTLEQLQGSAGIRVHGVRGGVQMSF